MQISADSARLYRDVAFLSSVYPYRNFKNPESLKKVADYIHHQFEGLGLHIERQKWEVQGEYYENVIASYNNEMKKRFIVGAHYDVFKDQPGADDNASSVAGILEMARIISQYPNKLDFGIDFVAYCLEEPPFFKTKQMGSYIHAQSLDQLKFEYIGMLALEMIGFYSEEKLELSENELTQKKVSNKQNYLMVSGIRTYHNFNKQISSLLRKNWLLGSRTLSFDAHYRNNAPSDHRNYWELNIPAAMIIGTGKSKNPHYHKITDTIETLDFTIMTEAVNSLVYTLLNFGTD